MQANYYFILNVKRTASSAEIKAAYKRLAILYHPDKHQGNLYFEEQFKQVNTAYQVLSNPQKRAAYDLTLEYLAQQQRLQQQQSAYHARQRQPASVRERHYAQRPTKRKVSKRDIQITIGFFLLLFLGILAVKLTMDAITARRRFQQAETYFREKNWSGAHSLLSEAIAFKPKFAEAYQKRALINQNIYQDYNAAIQDYDAALEFGETPKAETYFNRGVCFVKLRNYQQADRDFTMAIAADKNFRPAYFNRGELRLLNLSAWNDAIKDLNIYLQNPDSTEKNKALLYRGFAYYLTDHYPEAIQDYETALTSDARNGRLYYLIGKAEAAQGKAAEACNHFMYAYNIGYEPAIIDYQEMCGRR